MMKLKQHFSDFALKVRKERKLVGIDVVRLTGISKSTLYQIESGEQITVDNMDKWLTGMGLSLMDFVNYLKDFE